MFYVALRGNMTKKFLALMASGLVLSMATAQAQTAQPITREEVTALTTEAMSPEVLGSKAKMVEFTKKHYAPDVRIRLASQTIRQGKPVQKSDKVYTLAEIIASTESIPSPADNIYVTPPQVTVEIKSFAYDEKLGLADVTYTSDVSGVMVVPSIKVTSRQICREYWQRQKDGAITMRQAACSQKTQVSPAQ